MLVLRKLQILDCQSNRKLVRIVSLADGMSRWVHKRFAHSNNFSGATL